MSFVALSALRLSRSLGCGVAMALEVRMADAARFAGDEFKRDVHVTTPAFGRKSLKIATKKSAMDDRRAKVNGRYTKLVCQAAKKGADPSFNIRLRDLLNEARDLSVPKDLLDRAIKKATVKSQADYQEILYEVYGHGGVGFILECLTDNANRTASDVRSAVGKSGGKMAAPGSVAFNFEKVAQIVVTGDSISEEKVFEVASEAGALDIVEIEDTTAPEFMVISPAEHFASMQGHLRKAGFSVSGDRSGLVYRSPTMMEVDDEAFEKNEKMFLKLMEVDDVDSVYSNCEGLRL
ncbi:hypothetical protein BSKO_03513 [Bryopsis sp. KO-2023]|nr:hypothetical protein BSKO_03513 [Bryopsis sp. KO-2023]